MMSFSTSASSQNSEINVTPLIDVLLVLLIIFMVIVPVTPSGLKALSPQPPQSNAPSPPDPSTVVLEVGLGDSGETVYSVNQRAVPREALQGTLTAIFAPRQQRVLFLKGDPRLDFQEVADAVSAAHRAAITDIGILTPNTLAGH